MALTLPHAGSWGLPDIGFTELLQRLVRPAYAASDERGSNLIGGQTVAANDVRGLSPETQWTNNSGQVAGYGQTGLDAIMSNTPTAAGNAGGGAGGDGDVLGASSGNQDTSGMTQNQDYWIDEFGNVRMIDKAEEARKAAEREAARQAALQAIQARFGALKDFVSAKKGTADTIYNNALESVGGFRNRLKTGWDNAGQEITNQASELLGGNVKSFGDLMTQSANRARSMNLGDSAYLGLQGRLGEQLARSQGTVQASRGENERANQANLDSGMGEAQDLENAALTNKQNFYNDADQALSQGNIDFDYDTNAANTYYSNLENQLAQNQALTNQIQAPSKVDPYNASVANTDYLNSSVLPQTTAVASQDTGNPASFTTLAEQLKRMRSGSYAQPTYS